jgi:diketogulonate reductase-like aldo/keto reductase
VLELALVGRWKKKVKFFLKLKTFYLLIKKLHLFSSHYKDLKMACKIDLLFANGDKMPAMGLGTWRAPDAEVESAINAALEAGERR